MEGGLEQAAERAWDCLQGRQDGWSQSQDQPVVPALAGMGVGVLGGGKPRPGIKTSKFTTCDPVAGLPMQS